MTHNQELHPGYFNTETISQLLSVPWSEYSTTKKVKEPKSHQAENYRHKIIVLIPISIPGIGKSHFYENVVVPHGEKLGYAVASVSSD